MIERITPTWLSSYRRSDFGGDLVAGLTVGVMLVPQGMAYAILAGAPPIYGLYSSLVPLVLYTLFGTSRHLSVGIMAIDSLIVASSLHAFADLGTEAFVRLALLLTLMVGVIQIVMGLARFGFVVSLLSRPVIAGFTAAAAITIGLSQLKTLLAVPVGAAPDVLSNLLQTTPLIPKAHLPSLLIGVGGIALLIGLKRWAPRIPAPLVAVVLAAASVLAFGLEGRGVALVGAIPTGLPSPAMPDFDLATVRLLLPTAITLSLVQFMNVISLGKVFAARHKYRIDANRELVTLGLLNAVGSLFRSLPVSGSFSRSAVSEQSGGRSQLVNGIAAAVVALTLLLFTPLFGPLPLPVFASIIMVSAFGMVDIAELRSLFRAKRIDGVIAVLTFASTLVLGIQNGVLVGVFASVVAILMRISRPDVAELGRVEGTTAFRNVARHPGAERVEGVRVVRIDASLGFANADFLREHLVDTVASEDGVHAIVLDATSVNDLDTTAAAILDQVIDVLHTRGVRLCFSGVKGPVRDVMERSGLMEAVGRDHVYLTADEAVRACTGSP